ncbi:MAG: DUF255 domain-containing protein [Chryseobacterium sp.]|nr:MAG: DUF255 domain-containing protein [Chryseobacterium sp.]
MKNILTAFVLLIFVSTNAQVKWMSMSQAIALQKQKPKKILIDFYADWCAPCKIMDKETYANPVIAKYINDNFYAVKFDAEGNEKFFFNGRDFANPGYKAGRNRNTQHEFAGFMSIYSYPTTMFMDENFTPITSLMGLLMPNEIEPFLALIASNTYKDIKTREDWDSYQAKFKSKLKN